MTIYCLWSTSIKSRTRTGLHTHHTITWFETQRTNSQWQTAASAWNSSPRCVFVDSLICVQPDQDKFGMFCGAQACPWSQANRTKPTWVPGKKHNMWPTLLPKITTDLEPPNLLATVGSSSSHQIHQWKSVSSMYQSGLAPRCFPCDLQYWLCRRKACTVVCPGPPHLLLEIVETCWNVEAWKLND